MEIDLPIPGIFSISLTGNECKNCKAKYSFELIHNRSVYSDKQHVKLQETPDINSIFKEPTYDELKGHLEAWLNPSEDANAQPNVVAEDAPVASSAKTSAKVSKVDDVSSAFDELFNEN